MKIALNYGCFITLILLFFKAMLVAVRNIIAIDEAERFETKKRLAKHTMF